MRTRIACLISIFCLWISLCASATAETIVLAVPGPGTLSYLPVYLAKAIAADHAEGVELKLRYFSGGPLAMRDMITNNSDFVALGLPAIAAARADGAPVVAIGQLSQSAMYVLLLRADLKDQVHNIAQLKGRRIGTTSGTNTEHSMGYMMTKYLLQRAGLGLGDVQLIAAGQNRAGQRAALLSGTVEAIMGDEPFASELVADGTASRLADLYLPKNSNDLLGGTIIHAALATRADVYARHPDAVKKVMRMFDRTLQWMAQHSAQEIVDKLANQPGFIPAQRKLLTDILQRNQGMYTNHVAWDSHAVATTERFFHSTAFEPNESVLSFSDFVLGTPEK